MDDRTNKRVEFKVYNRNDKKYIEVYEKNQNENSKNYGNYEKRFKFLYSPTAPKIRDIKKTKSANEESLRYYYKNLSDEPYNPNTNDDNKKELNKLEEKKPKSETKNKKFKNGNQIIFTNNQRVKNFDYTYINVRVKVYFDGHHVIANGRSDYKYYEQIKNNEISFYLKQAIMRAISPYGSNLKYRALSWSFAYHQQLKR